MFAGHLEDLALALDDPSLVHLLVLTQDADDLGLVLPDVLGQLRRDVLSRVDLQGTLGLAGRESETCLRVGKQYVADTQNSASIYR